MSLQSIHKLTILQSVVVVIEKRHLTMVHLNLSTIIFHYSIIVMKYTNIIMSSRYHILGFWCKWHYSRFSRWM
jgi:hypothetical protein